MEIKPQWEEKQHMYIACYQTPPNNIGQKNVEIFKFCMVYATLSKMIRFNTASFPTHEITVQTKLRDYSRLASDIIGRWSTVVFVMK